MITEDVLPLDELDFELPLVGGDTPMAALTVEDTFGLMVFDDSVEAMRPALVPATAEQRECARAFLKNAQARGGTKLAEGVHQAAQALGGAGDILIITDGQVFGTEKILAEARATGKRLLVGSRPMTEVGRAVEKGETQGFMKVVVDADTQGILGAAILGTEGDEAIHGILDTMYAKASYRTLRRAVHIHPTVSELIPTMLGELKPLDPKSA